MTLQKLLKVGLVSIGLSVALTGCSRDHIEAVNLANEGDQAVKVNVEGAIQKYEQAVQLDPQNARAREALGRVLAALGRRDDALAQLREAVRIDPHLTSAHEGLARIEGETAP